MKRIMFAVLVLGIVAAGCFPKPPDSSLPGHNSSANSMLKIDGPGDTIPGCSSNWQPSSGLFPGYIVVHGNCTASKLWVFGGVRHDGGGTLTLSDSIVAGGGFFTALFMEGGGNLNLTDVTVQWKGNQPNPYADGSGTIHISGETNMVIRRSKISGNADGIQTSGSLLLEDSWVFGLAHNTGNHSDGIQVYCGQVTIRRSSVEQLPLYQGSNAAIFTQHFPGCPGGNVRFEDAYLNGGGYTLYCQAGTVTGTPQYGPDHRWGTELLQAPCTRTG